MPTKTRRSASLPSARQRSKSGTKKKRRQPRSPSSSEDSTSTETLTSSDNTLLSWGCNPKRKTKPQAKAPALAIPFSPMATPSPTISPPIHFNKSAVDAAILECQRSLKTPLTYTLHHTEQTSSRNQSPSPTVQQPQRLLDTSEDVDTLQEAALNLSIKGGIGNSQDTSRDGTLLSRPLSPQSESVPPSVAQASEHNPRATSPQPSTSSSSSSSASTSSSSLSIPRRLFQHSRKDSSIYSDDEEVPRTPSSRRRTLTKTKSTRQLRSSIREPPSVEPHSANGATTQGSPRSSPTVSSILARYQALQKTISTHIAVHCQRLSRASADTLWGYFTEAGAEMTAMSLHATSSEAQLDTTTRLMDSVRQQIQTIPPVVPRSGPKSSLPPRSGPTGRSKAQSLATSVPATTRAPSVTHWPPRRSTPATTPVENSSGRQDPLPVVDLQAPSRIDAASSSTRSPSVTHWPPLRPPKIPTRQVDPPGRAETVSPDQSRAAPKEQRPRFRTGSPGGSPLSSRASCYGAPLRGAWSTNLAHSADESLTTADIRFVTSTFSIRGEWSTRLF